MAQITEDYISFETAKLLKEKGFEGRMHTFYTEEGTEIESAYVVSSNFFPIYRPTLQMAIKWLREVHGLFIGIDYVNIAGLGFTYQTTILRKGEDYSYCLHKKSYEEACEAAIKYCLEELI